MPKDEIAAARLCYHLALIWKSLAGRSGPFQARLLLAVSGFYQKSILRSKKLFKKLFGPFSLCHPIQDFDDAIA